MKRLSFLILTTLIFMTVFCIPIKAATELEFELKYSGDVVVSETKEGSVILRGTNATTYSNVRVKVEVTGPGKPKIMATDTNNQELDIVELGYWGPDQGFPIAGTFENKTPIKATFPVAGTYTIKLSLVDMKSSEAEIISETFKVEVLEDASNVNEITNSENEIEKLPQTGNSIFEYIAYTSVIIALIIFAYYKMNMVKK